MTPTRTDEALKALERLMEHILGTGDHYGQGKRGLSGDIKIIEETLQSRAAGDDLQKAVLRASMEGLVRIWGDLKHLDKPEKPLKERPNLLWEMSMDDAFSIYKFLLSDEEFNEMRKDCVHRVCSELETAQPPQATEGG